MLRNCHVIFIIFLSNHCDNSLFKVLFDWSITDSYQTRHFLFTLPPHEPDLINWRFDRKWVANKSIFFNNIIEILSQKVKNWTVLSLIINVLTFISIQKFIGQLRRLWFLSQYVNICVPSKNIIILRNGLDVLRIFKFMCEDYCIGVNLIE